MHFTDGLPETTWEELQFGFHGYLYTVTGIVQYINNPDHFIAWLRNPYGESRSMMNFLFLYAPNNFGHIMLYPLASVR
jgi:hypothetical protein